MKLSSKTLEILHPKCLGIKNPTAQRPESQINTPPPRKKNKVAFELRKYGFEGAKLLAVAKRLHAGKELRVFKAWGSGFWVYPDPGNGICPHNPNPGKTYRVQVGSRECSPFFSITIISTITVPSSLGNISSALAMKLPSQ